MEEHSKIYIAGHKGLVGSAIKVRLEAEGFKNLIYRTSKELDLRDQKATAEFIEKERPDYVFLAAAKVGGIHANVTYPADFIYDNIQIQNNVIFSSWKNKVKKLMYFGSCCAYPKECSQPIAEECLLTGRLEPTNEPFAVAKIAGITMCQAYNKQYGTNFISIMPANLFGPKDNFHTLNSHIVGMTMRLMHEAKARNLESVTLAGTGAPVRDLLYVDDLADACLFLMKNYSSSEIINVGTEKGMTKKEIAYLVKEVVGYEGRLLFDSSKPDGMMKRVLDVSKIKNLGWKSESDVMNALKQTYAWFVESQNSII